MDEHTFDNGWDDSPLDSKTPDSVMARVVEVDGLIAGSRLMRLSAVAELDRDRGFEHDGYTSATAFLIHRCGMGAGEANREVFLARSLQHMTYAVKSAWAGHISLTPLELLAHARNRPPELFTEDEAALVDSISGLSASEARRAVDYWCQAHDHPDDTDDEEAEPSRAYLSKTWRGRWRLDGDLDKLTGDVLNTALDELMSQIVDTTPKDELQSASVRRAQALEEPARRFLDSPDAPTDHGNRPHLTAIIDWNILTGNSRSGVSELLDGTVITPEQAQQLACDAQICRLLTGPTGEILDLGRTVRTATPAQYKALRVRDRHCQWPGRHRPPAWRDAHHIQHWDHHR